MEKKRLQELAGLNEWVGTSKKDSIPNLSIKIFNVAEAMAFDEAKEGKHAVTGNMVHKHIDHILGEIKKHAVKHLEKEYKK